MRILCTCLPGFGHFLPMVPLARAAIRAGHEVAFATAGDFGRAIERADFPCFRAGLSLAEQVEEAGRRFPEQHALPPGRERFRAFVPRMLGGVAAPACAADLVPILDEWKPDVLVHDETEFGGPVAAAVANVPYVGHSVGILRPLRMARLARETIAPLWDRWQVDLGPFGGLFQHLYLDVCPPSLQSSEIDGVATAHPMQNLAVGSGDHGLPAWIDDLPPVPTVHVSLGTTADEADVLLTILEGLGGEDLEVIVTLGTPNDPADLGHQPDNVHVERFLPQAPLLPLCDAAVIRGGTAILPMLAHGLPMLILPREADQFHDADACTAAGVARSILPHDLTADAVRRDVRALLDDAAYGRRAGRLAREIEEMPSPDHGVELLERLARDRRPVMSLGAVDIE